MFKGGPGFAPFVKVADWKQLGDLKAVTPDQVKQFRENVKKTLEGLPMDELKDYLAQSTDQYKGELSDQLWKLDKAKQLERGAAALEDDDPELAAAMRAKAKKLRGER